MAEPIAGRETTHRAESDASRANAMRPRPERRRPALLLRLREPRELLAGGLAVAAAVALILSYFEAVVYVTVAGGIGCQESAPPALAGECPKSGADQHSVAFILLGVLVLVMGAIALVARSRAAGSVLALTGAVALAIALSGDLPQTLETGHVRDVTQAAAHAGFGFWLEVVGGCLAISAAAAIGLRRRQA